MSRVARKETFKNQEVIKGKIFEPAVADTPEIRELFVMLKF